MGGRGASSSVGSINNASKDIKAIQAQFDKLKDRNIKLYKENNGFAITGDLKQIEKRNKAYKEWLENRNKLGKLQQQINGERARKEISNKQENNKTFVNSYGEATNREITSSTYRRQQKRMERAVRRNLGR